MFLNVGGGRETKSPGLLPHISQIQIIFVFIHFKLHSPVFGEAKTLLILKTGQLVLIEILCSTSLLFCCKCLFGPPNTSQLSFSGIHALRVLANVVPISHHLAQLQLA